jgi:GNAT superfamily N-acetyltransferase
VAELSRIPIAFLVQSRLEIEKGDGGHFTFAERPVDPPYLKDYDALGSGGPAAWATRFDLTGWGLMVAVKDGTWIGSAVVAAGAAGLDLLEGRVDLGLLWDLRVAPAHRGRGVGSALFGAAETWAAARGCTELKVETQDINVPACRLYEARGCRLRAIDRAAYPGLDEVQMLWYRALA